MSSFAGNRRDDLGLVVLADGLEELHRLVARHHSRSTGSSFFASSAMRFSIAARSSGVNGRL